MRYNLITTSFKESSGRVRICIGADFVPTESNKDIFQCGNAEKLFGEELFLLFNQSNLNIFNLEAPITNSEHKLEKAGSPNLKTYKEITSILTKIKPVLLSCANNHILDYGNQGIKDTMYVLDSAAIPYVGLGLDKKEAGKNYIKDFCGVKIGVYSCAENEFSTIKNHMGGG